MTRLAHAGIVAIACTLLAPACDQKACACDPVVSEVTGMLFGTVYSPDSVAVLAATVRLTGGIGSCEPDPGVSVEDGVSGATGDYQAYFDADELDGQSLCIIAWANAPASSGFVASDAIQLMYDDADHNRQIVEEHDFYLKAPPGAWPHE